MAVSVVFAFFLVCICNRTLSETMVLASVATVGPVFLACPEPAPLHPFASIGPTALAITASYWIYIVLAAMYFRSKAPPAACCLPPSSSSCSQHSCGDCRSGWRKHIDYRKWGQKLFLDFFSIPDWLGNRPGSSFVTASRAGDFISRAAGVY